MTGREIGMSGIESHPNSSVVDRFHEVHDRLDPFYFDVLDADKDVVFFG